MYKLNLKTKKRNLFNDSTRLMISFACLFSATAIMALFSFSFANAKSDHASTGAQQISRTEKKPLPQAEPATEIKPGVCTIKTIEFTTTTVNDASMYQGETKETGGSNGWLKTCTADSSGVKPNDENAQPINKIISVGTKPKPTAPAPAPLSTRELAAQKACLKKRGYTYSLTKHACIRA